MREQQVEVVACGVVSLKTKLKKRKRRKSNLAVSFLFQVPRHTNHIVTSDSIRVTSFPMHYVTFICVLFSIVCLCVNSQQAEEFPRCPRTDGLVLSLFFLFFTEGEKKKGDGHCTTDLEHLRPLRFTRPLIETRAHVRLFEKQLETGTFDPGFKIVAIVIGFDGSLFALDKYAFLSALVPFSFSPAFDDLKPPSNSRKQNR